MEHGMVSNMENEDKKTREIYETFMIIQQYP